MIYRKKIVIGSGIAGMAIPLYLIPNHFPLMEPALLPWTFIDEAVPFIPDSIWVYHSEYLMIVSAYLLADSPMNLSRFHRTIMAVLVISALVFLIYPTTYPRDRFPLPEVMSAGSRFLLELQRMADTPHNCFPSLHVGSVFTVAQVFKTARPRLWYFYFLWAIAISVSTLTTKQHYLWDVLGGFVLFIVCNVYFNRKLSRQ